MKSSSPIQGLALFLHGSFQGWSVLLPDDEGIVNRDAWDVVMVQVQENTLGYL